MNFRGPPAALKQKNYHNSTNMQPIITYFQDQLKFTRHHILVAFSKLLNVFCLCYSHASFFLFFLFLINFQRHMQSICVQNMIKQSKSLQTRYDTKHINDKYCMKTHVYTFRFCVKKACLNYHKFDLEGDHIGVPHTWYLLARSFITIFTLL